MALIDISTDAGRAMATVAEIGTALPMIALHLSQPDASAILRLLRQGVREFVSPPMDATQLTLMLLRLIEPLAKTDEKQPGTVTLVVPGKPGSGASSVAVQLAAETERNGIGPLLLLDTDSAADTVAFLLKMQPEYRLSDALRDWARMDGELWTRMVMRAGGLHVLAAPDPANPVHLDRAGAAEVLDFCRQSYPVTIIDAGGVTQDSTGHFASVADHLLMVTTPDLPALHATRRSIEWLERAGIERQKIQLVVNNRFPGVGLARQDVESALKMAVVAVLAADPQEMHRAALDGRPATAKSPFARSVQPLAPTGSNPGAQTTPASQCGLRGWFSSRHR